MSQSPLSYNDVTTMLCEILKDFTPEQQDALLYDGRERACRDLANWREEHQRQDRIREEREAQQAEEKRLALQRPQAEAQAQSTYRETYDRVMSEEG